MCSETDFTQETSHFHPTTGSFNKTVTRNLLLTDPKKFKMWRCACWPGWGWSPLQRRKRLPGGWWRCGWRRRWGGTGETSGWRPWQAQVGQGEEGATGCLCDSTTVFSWSIWSYDIDIWLLRYISSQFMNKCFYNIPTLEHCCPSSSANEE